jgi:antitoxin VapB
MDLIVKHPAVDRLARERQIRQRGKSRSLRVRDELRAIRGRCTQYPVPDPRSADEIVGYDEHGLPR